MDKTINKGMFGLFFEDINYGLDGGLHAEMLENRAFEFVEGRGYKCHYHQEDAFLYGWKAFSEGSTELSISTDKPLNSVNPHYLVVNASEGSAFTNKAYDGIFLSKEKSARISFYARADKNNSVTISIFSKDKSKELCKTELITIDSADWKKYSSTITAGSEIEEGIFTVTISNVGEICFDQFRMYPDDAVLGLFRKDLTDLLKDLKPGFMRFPGGCVVEGNELSNRYQWKKTIGPSEERASNWNRWAVHGNDDGDKKDVGKFSHYNQTLGIGFYEYFLLCEYLGCEPLPVMNVGLACQYQSDQLVPSDSPEFDEYVQDALDLIEFANGDINTTWGKKRAEMGHKEPFNLKLIGIGNEQWETEKVDFFIRYEKFEKAIHEKYPEIKCCGSAGPDVTSTHYTDAWNHFSPKMKENANYSYAVDEHYYVSDEWMYKNVHMYDNYDKHKKVFAGEYACHINPNEVPERRNSFAAALAEAAFMTGLERNADVVLMASYAPLFARLGYTQWQPDMIWFDAKRAYGTPSYYVQKLFSCYTGNVELDLEGKFEEYEKDKVYTCISKDTSKTYIKLVNAGDKDVELDFSEFISDKACAETYFMYGEPSDCNSVDEPEKVSLQKEQLDFEGKITVKAFSAGVVII